MKNKFVLFFCLASLTLFVNGQNASENPIAFKYFLKHFELKGKVKSITTYGTTNNLMTSEIFDAEGRLSIYTSFSGITTKSQYSYDKNKRLITVSQQSGNLPELKNLYQYNNNNEVEFSLYKENDPLRKFEYKGSLLIKDSGANKYSSQKVYYSYYHYNNKGQLTKLMAYNGGDKISREEVFSYEKNIVTITGKAYWTIGKVDDYEKKKHYDTKGNLIKSTFTQNGKTETTEYKLDAQGNWIWKTGGMTRKIEYYDEVAKQTNATNPATKNAANKVVVSNNLNVASAESKIETKAISPEPHETTYKKELQAANNYTARGLALAKYVDALMATQLTDVEKEVLLLEKIKEMIDIDFMGLHHMWMKVKNLNVSFVSKVINSKLTSEQKTALKDFNVYTVDDFVANQNNKPKPIWPANMPKPGYGWGKTVSSDKPIIKVQPSYPVVNNNEIPLSNLVGIVFKYSSYNGASKAFCTVTGYKNRDEIYISFFKGGKRTVTYDELLDDKVSLNGFDVAETVTCGACKGKGTVTSTFSHTNNYQYTLGQKHTYTKTTTSNCNVCAGSGFNYQ